VRAMLTSKRIAEFIVGPRFARTRWPWLQDERRALICPTRQTKVAHDRHAKIARRASLPHQARIAEKQNQWQVHAVPAHSVGRHRPMVGCAGRDAMAAAVRGVLS